MTDASPTPWTYDAITKRIRDANGYPVTLSDYPLIVRAVNRDALMGELTDLLSEVIEAYEAPHAISQGFDWVDFGKRGRALLSRLRS